MIVISDFTELNGDPRYGGINAADFGASKFCFSADTLAKLVAVWGDEYESEEPGFKLYGFDRKLKFSLNEPIIYAKFEPRAAQIWLARRDSKKQISILLYGYGGELRANLVLPDELENSGVWMDELPQTGGMAVGLGAGQDGSRSFLLQAKGSGLNLTAELEDDFSFFFVMAGKKDEREGDYAPGCKFGKELEDTSKRKLENEQTRRQKCILGGNAKESESQINNQPRYLKSNFAREAVLLNLYEQEIALSSYPQLEPLRRFSFPDEIALDGETRGFMLGGIAPLSDRIWLVRDDGYFRHYLFDAGKFEFIDEIALAGFEPKNGGAGEITSQICDLDCFEGKLIFTRYELGEPDRYFEADAAEIGVYADLMPNFVSLKTKI